MTFSPRWYANFFPPFLLVVALIVVALTAVVVVYLVVVVVAVVAVFALVFSRLLSFALQNLPIHF